MALSTTTNGAKRDAARRKVLVIGGTQFIGNTLVKELVKAGHEVSVLRGASAILRKYLPPMLIEIEQRHLGYPIKDVFAEIEDIGYSLYFIDGAVLYPIDQFDLERHQMSSVVPDEFTPFSMPAGYVYNFCAVAMPDMLSGVPGFTW